MFAGIFIVTASGPAVAQTIDIKTLSAAGNGMYVEFKITNPGNVKKLLLLAVPNNGGLAIQQTVDFDPTKPSFTVAGPIAGQVVYSVWGILELKAGGRVNSPRGTVLISTAAGVDPGTTSINKLNDIGKGKINVEITYAKSKAAAAVPKAPATLYLLHEKGGACTIIPTIPQNPANTWKGDEGAPPQGNYDAVAVVQVGPAKDPTTGAGGNVGSKKKQFKYP